MHDRLSDAVCQQIACQDIQRKAHKRFPSMLLVLEGEVLIKYVATDAAKEIVRGRRYPIAKSEQIVEYKHNRGTNNRVDDTYHDKLHESLVSKKSYLIF